MERKNRIIKFRAWDNEAKQYFIPEYIDNEWQNVYYNYIDIKNLDAADCILEQFAGLYDSTKWNDLRLPEQTAWTLSGNPANEWPGREIYEGDILEYYFPKSIITDSRGYAPSVVKIEIIRKVGIINFHDGHFQITGDFNYFNHKINEWKFKVIGNIHENPELLGVKA